MAKAARAKATAVTTPVGNPGFAHYGGYIQTPERRSDLVGAQKWTSFADIATNYSIVAAGTRHFLGLIARTEWKVEPANDVDGDEPSDAAKKAADFIESVMYDMVTPWSKVMRRASMYRFNGFGVQEWTAKRRDDGRFGLSDIAPRPCHTIERWEIDPESGAILGMYQRNPQNGREVFLPRGKVLYLVDDALTDAPDGLGLYRHLVEPAKRLQEYLRLEGIGYQRDLRGIPIGRAPLAALNAMVAKGELTEAQRDTMIRGLEDLVKMQAKTHDTGLLLSSQPYESATDTGNTPSSTKQWDVELITGNAAGIESLGNAINRLNRELARVLGVEQLMLGEGAGTRSLSEDKTSSFFLQVEGALADIAETAEKDLVDPVWDLNGFDPALKPTLRYEAVQFKDVAKITAALRDMATAGATLGPDDPAINDVRDLLGISEAPEMDPEIVAGMRRQAAGLPDPDEDDPEVPEKPEPGEDDGAGK